MSTKFKSQKLTAIAPARKQKRKPGVTTSFIDEVLPWKARCFVVGDGDSFDEWGNDVRGPYVIQSHWDVYMYLALEEKPDVAFIRFVPSVRHHFGKEEIINALAAICMFYPYMKTLDKDMDDWDCVVLLAQEEGTFVRTLRAMDWIADNSDKYYEESKYSNEEDTFD